MNITANEARTKSNEILKPVNETPEFQKIMSRIERDIHAAIADGLESIEIVSYLLPIYNDYACPSFINRAAINLDKFWWPYVEAELKKNGFSVYDTITLDHYIVSW